jgi:hypothetical protein
MLCARRLPNAVDGVVVESVLFHDRDPLYTEAAFETLAAAGGRTVRAPPLADVNVHAE